MVWGYPETVLKSAPTPRPPTLRCGIVLLSIAPLLCSVVIGLGTAVSAEEIGNNDNGFDFNFNGLFTHRSVTIASVVVAIIFELLNGIIALNLPLFAVTTAITIHDNESEIDGCDCKCVFENVSVAVATQIESNGLIGFVCYTPHGACFSTIIFGSAMSLVLTMVLM